MKYKYCGVIYNDEYERMKPFDVPEDERMYGYLCVSRPMSVEAWIGRYGE